MRPGRATLRSRSQRGRGRLAAVLGLTCLVLLSLSFLLGVLVGRQWALGRNAAEKPGRAAQAASVAVKDREAGRPPQIQEKLTFYRTLTAPLAGVPSKPGSKVPQASAGVPPPEDNRAAQVRPEPPAGGPPPARGPQEAPAEPDPGAPAIGHPWTVQVGAYRSRDQASTLVRVLATAGYDAYLTTVTVQDGAIRYRVRVGSYPSRSEAEKVSEQLRAERRGGGGGGALAPIVVPW